MALRIKGGTWYFRFMLDGREYERTTGLDAIKRNESKARARESEFRQALLEGRTPQKRILIRTFNDAGAEFLKWAETAYREHRNSYLRIKTSFASLQLFFSGEPVSAINEARVEAFKAWRVREHAVRDITVRHDLHALSSFFQYAAKQRWATDNPVRRVAIPSDREAVRMHILTAAEEKAYFLLAAKNERLHDLAVLMLQQGCRPSEITALRKEDVDLERGELQIRKGKTSAARRMLNLTAESRLILAHRLTKAKTEWLWYSPWTEGHIQRLNRAHDALLERSAQSGIKLAFVLYDLRHTFATRMAQAGVDLATLAAILGHSSLRIVQKYVHPTAEHKKLAMDKYERANALAAGAGR